MHLYPCFANGVCYSDHGVFLHLNLPLHRLYFFASHAWMAVSPLSVTSKVSDGWGSAFSMMPMYKKCIRCLLFMRPRRVSTNALLFFLLPTHVFSELSFSYSFASSLGWQVGCWQGVALRALLAWLCSRASHISFSRCFQKPSKV
jgi:hypothetical protein